jgi:uncharacterized membrane protein
MDTHSWSVLVATHTVGASLAMVLGAVQVARRRRGDRPHRAIGRVWLVLMYFTALSSFWIQQIRPGSFSWIHALSAFTLVTLTLGLANARRGNIRGHAGNMIGTYAGLWGAFIGVVAVPDRLVPQAFQANWLAMAALTLLIVGIGLAFTSAATRLLAQAPPAVPAARSRAGSPAS